MNQRTAPLRCCASCMWIFTWEPGTPCPECPQCAFGHYGARHVFGDRAYRYAKTQQPWYDRRMAKHSEKLHQIIERSKRESRHDQQRVGSSGVDVFPPQGRVHYVAQYGP